MDTGGGDVDGLFVVHSVVECLRNSQWKGAVVVGCWMRLGVVEIPRRDAEGSSTAFNSRLPDVASKTMCNVMAQVGEWLITLVMTSVNYVRTANHESMSESISLVLRAAAFIPTPARVQGGILIQSLAMDLQGRPRRPQAMNVGRRRRKGYELRQAELGIVYRRDKFIPSTIHGVLEDF
ncbi:hypothetical protein AXG93_1069s1100 [Marchantia polymorpha subsp. ruderalis]|uniref:Uncharacterized protein n=1 Tax=Marchantia polymorpha subsp. ruderalis TaxID=1480154 RepID=A0A176WE85_MARPO|nr:hypothetical protein AXG93_1069s1100 [Marchantia polymorpha subsp. ruderalis]